MSKKKFLLFSVMGILLTMVLTLALVPPVEGKGKVYGKEINQNSGITVDLPGIFSKTDEYVKKNIVVESRILQVCPTSGCWIILTDGTNQLMVQFYDFTVSSLSPGTLVRVSGQLRMRNKAPYLAAQGLEVLS
jgi:hypothetical protein